MKFQLLHSHDINLCDGEYALQLGMSIIDSFKNGGDHFIVFYFDDILYTSWLNGCDDTLVMRDAWVEYKLRSISGSFLSNTSKQMKICQVCNKDFKAISKAKFCSNACRQKNKRLLKI